MIAWSNKFYSFNKAGILSRCGYRIMKCCRNQPSKGTLALRNPLLHFKSYLNNCIWVSRQSTSIIKVGVMCVNAVVYSHELREHSYVATWFNPGKLFCSNN